ncbi:MAG: xanthine dehydrogenase molybdopterin binding subunit, partial [Comamonadaceae bacterium]
MNKPLPAHWLQPADAFAGHAANAAARIDAATEADRATRGERVGISLPHESARLHVAGEAAYIDDIPELAGTLHCALGLSPVAGGTLVRVDVERLRASPGVVTVLLAADIPGSNDCGSIVHDDPILCDGEIRYLGQPLFAVVAETRDAARRAAALAADAIEVSAAGSAPVLTPQRAHELGRYVVPPMHLVRSAGAGAPVDARYGPQARAAVRAAIERAPHRLRDTLDVGGQEQFYLEGQISYAIPKEGGTLHLHCSTQHPT